MKTIVQEYRQFLKDNFKGLEIRTPLFYKWDYGLRFNLQTGENYNSSRQVMDTDGNIIPLIGDTDKDEYFYEVTRRASTLFQMAFNNSDQIFLILRDYKYGKRKIRLSNYAFKQISGLKKTEVTYTKEHQLYYFYKTDRYNLALLKLPTSRLEYKNILLAIANTDFPPRQPRLDKKGFLSSKEIYFLNIDRKIIFHMYDDRGLDIIAADKETLRPIYKTHNDWILNYDREKIEKLFE